LGKGNLRGPIKARARKQVVQGQVPKARVTQLFAEVLENLEVTP
jgi:hypothetical protein